MPRLRVVETETKVKRRAAERSVIMIVKKTIRHDLTTPAPTPDTGSARPIIPTCHPWSLLFRKPSRVKTRWGAMRKRQHWYCIVVIIERCR